MFFDIVHNLEGSSLPGQSQSAGTLTTDISGPEDFLVALLNSLPVQLPPTPVAEAVAEQLGTALPLAGEGLPLSGNVLPATLAVLGSDRSPDRSPAHPPVVNQDGEYDALPLSALRQQLPEVLVPDVQRVVGKGPVIADTAALTPPVFELPVFQPAPHGHTMIQAPAASLEYQPATQTPAFSLAQPVGRPEWGEALGTRVVWLARQGIQAAEVRLHPAHLGPIEIQVSIADETARVAFAAHHPHTREALEAALPQLKEMFAAQGLQLADAAVSHRFSESGNGRENSMLDDSPPGTTESEQEPEVRVERTRVGLVDDYA